MNAPIIAIFVRHTPDCKFKGDEFSRRCQCKKHLRWSHGGKQFRKAANTRSWAEAEEVKREIVDQLAGRAPAPVEAAHTIGECTGLFITEKTLEGISTFGVGDYKREMGRLERYCGSKGVFTVGFITRELMLSYMSTWPALYPSSWTRWRNRSRLNSFLYYCERHEWIRKAPLLPKIVPDEQPTTPLTPEEFDRLLAAVPVAVKEDREQNASVDSSF